MSDDDEIDEQAAYVRQSGLLGQLTDHINELRAEITALESTIRALSAENAILRDENTELREGRLLSPERASRNEAVLRRAFGPMIDRDHPSFGGGPNGAA